jgi:hypothetical protein
VVAGDDEQQTRDLLPERLPQRSPAAAGKRLLSGRD